MALSEPSHINYYKHVMRNGTAHYATDVGMNEWANTIPRYAKFNPQHPLSTSSRPINVYGAFESQALPNPYRKATQDYQDAKDVGDFDYLEGVPSVSVLQAPDVVEQFDRIEASVPITDPNREETINQLKRRYLRTRVTTRAPPRQVDQAGLLERGRATGVAEESQRSQEREIRALAELYVRRKQTMLLPFMVRYGELLGLDVDVGMSRGQLISMIDRVRNRGEVDVDIGGGSGSAEEGRLSQDIVPLQPQDTSRDMFGGVIQPR